MNITKAKNPDVEKLVENIPGAVLDIPLTEKPSTKKRVRRVVEPHVRAREVTKNGKKYVYYCYVRGTDREIYLGDADFILQAILEMKRGGRSGETSRRGAVALGALRPRGQDNLIASQRLKKRGNPTLVN
jgi:hypothetical protein